MLNTDYEATKAAKFRNKKSRVLLDGREILGRLDYKDRKVDVLIEQGYKCAKCLRLILYDECGHLLGDLHHKVKRSKLRDDRKGNVEVLCFGCHRKVHNQA